MLTKINRTSNSDLQLFEIPKTARNSWFGGIADKIKNIFSNVQANIATFYFSTDDKISDRSIQKRFKFRQSQKRVMTISSFLKSVTLFTLGSAILQKTNIEPLNANELLICGATNVDFLAELSNVIKKFDRAFFPLPVADAQSYMNFVGIERMINSAHSGTYPCISSLSNQGFMCAWTHLFSSKNGVAANIFGSASLTNITTSEYQVDTPNGNNQMEPRIGKLTNGNTVIIYRGNSVISGKLYDNNNNAIGSQFDIPGSTGATDYPRLTVHSNGFIVFFGTLVTSNLNVYAQRYDNQGNTQGGLLLNPPLSTKPLWPEGTCYQDTCLAVWVTRGVDSGTTYGVSGQVISPLNGTTLVNVFQVNQYTIGDQWLPTVATLTSGRYLVAYSSYGQNTGSNWEVWFQIRKMDGSIYVAETFVDAYETLSSTNNGFLSVVALPNDEFLLLWESNLIVTSGYDIKVQRFSGEGQALGSIFIVNTMTTGDQSKPVATLLGTGEVVVAWEDGSGDIRGQILSIGTLPTPTPSVTPTPTPTTTSTPTPTPTTTSTPTPTPTTTANPTPTPNAIPNQTPTPASTLTPNPTSSPLSSASTTMSPSSTTSQIPVASTSKLPSSPTSTPTTTTSSGNSTASTGGGMNTTTINPTPSASSTTSKLINGGQAQTSKVPTWVIVAASVSSLAFLIFCTMFLWCVSRYRKLKKKGFSSIFNGRLKFSAEKIDDNSTGNVGSPQTQPSATIVADFAHQNHSLTVGSLTVTASDNGKAHNNSNDTENNESNDKVLPLKNNSAPSSNPKQSPLTHLDLSFSDNHSSGHENVISMKRILDLPPLSKKIPDLPTLSKPA